MAGKMTRRTNGGLYGIVGGLILAVGIAYFVSHGGYFPDSDTTVAAEPTTLAPATGLTKP